MSDPVIKTPSKKKAKKEIRKTLQEKISGSLADYKSIVGEKKFNSRIRKAAKSLGADIVNAKPKKEPKIKKTEKVKSSV
jgi:predicted ArsR family transcriptional regulator